MATNSEACISISSSHYNGAWYDYSTTRAEYAGKTVASGTYTYYPAIIKFTTPEFTGVSEKIEIKYSATKYRGDNPTLFWALCNSDANKNNYKSASAVTDSNQLKSGEITHSSIGNQYSIWTISIDINSLKSETTYYLFLWGDSSTRSTLITLNTAANHTVTLYYNSGIVKIYTNDGWKNAIPYVYTNSGWKMTIPYVYKNDTDGWKICSG